MTSLCASASLWSASFRALTAALLLAAPLAACGKKGDLLPPPGEESHYPRQYPAPESYTVPEEPDAQ